MRRGPLLNVTAQHAGQILRVAVKPGYLELFKYFARSQV